MRRHWPPKLRPLSEELGADREAGFTLIEILVAFAIAVIALGALYQLFGLGARADGAASRLENAIVIARSALNAASVVDSGEKADRVGAYRRQVLVRRRPDLVVAGAPAGLSEADVDVSWLEGRRERSIVLSSLHVISNPAVGLGK
jgi:general secretion pathway protein I